MDTKNNVNVIGNIKVLPFHNELKKIIATSRNIYKRNRVIIIYPTQNILDIVLSKYPKHSVFCILNKGSFLKASSRVTAFYIFNSTRPCNPGIKIIQNTVYAFGKIATVLLYTFIFDDTKNINELKNYSLGYNSSIENHNLLMKPLYKSTISINNLIIDNYDKSFSLIGSTIICACHLKNIQDIDSLINRCVKLMKSINHKNIIYVYSIADDKQDVLNYIKDLTFDNAYFIYDNINGALDAGKYLIGLNSISSINDIYQNNGVITLFNDSVLMSDNLTSFSIDYRSCKNKYDIIGCTSSWEKSWHLQSWFLSFANKLAIIDFINMLTLINIDTDNLSQSIIDQMEVGTCAYLSVKYKSTAIYPVHAICFEYAICGSNNIGKNVRSVLEYCGMPFVKKRLLNYFKDKNIGIDLLGINVENYS